MINKNDNPENKLIFNGKPYKTSNIIIISFLTIIFLIKKINTDSLPEINKPNKESMLNPNPQISDHQNSTTNHIEFFTYNKTNYFRDLNTTIRINTNSSSNLTDNAYELKLIQKTPINYTHEDKINIQCKNNLILKLLPQALVETIYDNLNEFPTQTELKKCKLTESSPYLSCCNENTINLFSDYLKKTIIPTKTNIFANNIFYLSLIQNEHHRNFIDGFGLSEENFNEMFQEFKNFKNQVYKLTETIVKESIKYTWSSFCNYVCRPDYFNFYNSYNYTFSLNNTISYGLFVEFFNDESKITNVTQYVTEFVQMQKNFNSKVGEIYAKMITKSAAFNYTNKNNDTAFLVKKSLEDGQNFFFQMNKELPCDENMNKTKFGCVEILKDENICKPFLCLDNIFLQFIDLTEEPIEYELDNYNYTNSLFSKNSEKRIGGFENEIMELIDSEINFSGGNNLNLKFSFMNLFWFMIILFFI